MSRRRVKLPTFIDLCTEMTETLGDISDTAAHGYYQMGEDGGVLHLAELNTRIQWLKRSRRAILAMAEKALSTARAIDRVIEALEGPIRH